MRIIKLNCVSKHKVNFNLVTCFGAVARLILDSSLTNACKLGSTWIGMTWLPYWLPPGETEESIVHMPQSMQMKGSTLALKPRTDVTISGPTKRTDVL